MPEDSENGDPPAHMKGYANLGLVIDRKLQRENKYVKATLGMGNRRQSHGMPYQGPKYSPRNQKSKLRATSMRAKKSKVKLPSIKGKKPSFNDKNRFDYVLSLREHEKPQKAQG